MDDDRNPSGVRPATAATLDAIIRPRFPGSPGWSTTREAVRRRFADLGYAERTQPFQASLLPGTWGLPAAGLVLSTASLCAIAAILSGHSIRALLVLICGAAGVIAIAVGAAAATDRWTAGRITLCNHSFARSDARPRWLFVAHLDSKSQFVPLMLRSVAAGAALLGWAGLMARVALGDGGPVDPLVLGILAVITCLSGITLVLSGAGNDSPGALDNATGVATLLGLAAAQRGHTDIAFLITDGEELGLAGSRAALARLAPVEGVINVDGIDDHGAFFVLDRFGVPRRNGAPVLATALVGSAAFGTRRRDVPVGLVLDHMSFARAGIPAVTLMRGTVGSLARVHRPADARSRLSGRGVDAAVELLEAGLERLRARPARVADGAQTD